MGTFEEAALQVDDPWSRKCPFPYHVSELCWELIEQVEGKSTSADRRLAVVAIIPAFIGSRGGELW